MRAKDIIKLSAPKKGMWNTPAPGSDSDPNWKPGWTPEGIGYTTAKNKLVTKASPLPAHLSEGQGRTSRTKAVVITDTKQPASPSAKPTEVTTAPKKGMWNAPAPGSDRDPNWKPGWTPSGLAQMGSGKPGTPANQKTVKITDPTFAKSAPTTPSGAKPKSESKRVGGTFKKPQPIIFDRSKQTPLSKTPEQVLGEFNRGQEKQRGLPTGSLGFNQDQKAHSANVHAAGKPASTSKPAATAAKPMFAAGTTPRRYDVKKDLLKAGPSYVETKVKPEPKKPIMITQANKGSW